MKILTIKREAALVSIGGIIGAFAAKGVDNFINNLIGKSTYQVILNFIGFGIFFFVLLLASNFLLKKVDERTITNKRIKK